MSDSQPVTIAAAGKNSTNAVRAAPYGTGAEPGTTVVPGPGQPPGGTRKAPAAPSLLRPHSAPARASRPRRTGRPRDQWTWAARHHLAHHQRRPPLARRTRQGSRPRRGRRRRGTTQNRTGTAHGHRTGPRTGRSPRHLRPPNSADQPQTRRSPAKGTRRHPRPDRRGLPRQQREDPPGPPLGPCGRDGRPQTPQNAQTARGRLKRTSVRCAVRYPARPPTTSG